MWGDKEKRQVNKFRAREKFQFEQISWVNLLLGEWPEAGYQRPCTLIFPQLENGNNMGISLIGLLQELKGDNVPEVLR